MPAPLLREPLRKFAATLTVNFSVAAMNPAQSEDQLKGPIQALLAEAGSALVSPSSRAPRPRRRSASVPISGSLSTRFSRVTSS